MKKVFFSISKIALSILTIPLWFVDMFKQTGILFDKNTGEFIHKTFYSSMFVNISGISNYPIPYISIALAVISVITNLLAWKFSNNKTMKIIANISFWVAIVLFLLFLLLASTVVRDY